MKARQHAVRLGIGLLAITASFTLATGAGNAVGPDAGPSGSGPLDPGTPVIRADAAKPAAPAPRWSKQLDSADDIAVEVGRVEVYGSVVVTDQVGFFPGPGDPTWVIVGRSASTGKELYRIPYKSISNDVPDAWEFPTDFDSGGIYQAYQPEWAPEYRQLQARDLATGKHRWTKDLGPDVRAYDVYALGDRVVIRDNTGAYRAYAQADGKLLWTNDSGTIPWGAARRAGSWIFIAADCGVVSRVNAVTGARSWTARKSGDCKPTGAVAPVIYNGRVYASFSGKTFKVYETGTGKLLGTRTWDVMPTVDITTGIGYFTRDGVTTAVDLRKSKTLWRLHVTSGVRRVDAVASRRISIVSNKGVLYVLDSATGRVKWSQAAPAGYPEPYAKAGIGGQTIVAQLGPKLNAYGL